MRKLKSKIILGAMFLFLTIHAGANSNSEDNSAFDEFWQELYVYGSLGNKWTGEILFNNLYSSQWGNYDWFLEGRIKFRAQKYLDIEAMYRHEFYDLNGIEVQEYRPMLRFSGKVNPGKWSIRNRHRFELRMFEVGETRFRYRTDLKIKRNFNWTSFNFNPYLLEEIFVSTKKFSRNRIYLGIEGKKGRFEPTVYSLLQSDNVYLDWYNRLIVGVMLGIELN